MYADVQLRTNVSALMIVGSAFDPSWNSSNETV